MMSCQVLARLYVDALSVGSEIALQGARSRDALSGVGKTPCQGAMMPCQMLVRLHVKKP